MERSLHLIFVNIVLEDFSMHDILVLVHKGTKAVCRAVMMILEVVELFGAVKVDGGGDSHRIVAFLIHRVNVSVDI